MHRLLSSALLMFAGIAQANAAELPDCRLDSSLVVTSILERSRPSPEYAVSLNVVGTLRNGAPVAYAKDDAVLVVDLQVVRAIPSVVPTANVLLRNSWALSSNYRLAAERPLPAVREIKLEDGRIFRIIWSDYASILLVNEEGRFCNKAINARSPPYVWIAGTLSQEPDDVPLLSRTVEEQGPGGSLRIIFNGIGAGQMSFQEVWVHGSTVLSSTARNFDQFAQSIKIGPFSFDVVETGGGKVTLRYEIAERSPIGETELERLPLRNRR